MAPLLRLLRRRVLVAHWHGSVLLLLLLLAACSIQPSVKPTPTPRPQRALVLGGGGTTGRGWELGVLKGLYDAGVDLTQADLFVGTKTNILWTPTSCGSRSPTHQRLVFRSASGR